ncbi:MAG: methyltransferase [Fusobacterium sp.]|nr:methyltransferase [Fusobacterium sp.]
MKKEILLNEDEYIEKINEKYKIIQKEKGFKFGTDTVLLCKFISENINLEKYKNILDIGTGNGIIPILLSENLKINNFIGMDIQEENIERAKKNIKLNNLDNLYSFECCDIKKYEKGNFFDLIISNPPYMEQNGKKINDNSHRAISRHEIFLNLKDFIKNSKRLLKPIGKLCFIHRTFKLVEIIKELDENKFSVEKIIFIYSENKETNLMYVQAVKGKQVKLKIENYFI